MGRIVLVTGASRGIGRVTAAAFAAAGWTTLLAARDRNALESVASETGGVPLPTDVTDPEAVSALFARISADHGRLDAVFNNAGSFTAATDPGDLSFADWRRVMSVNLDGAFLIASGAFALMKQQTPQGGRIINNGSISAQVPRPMSVAYTASKHAVTGLTKSIALDGRAHGIACSQIDIGNAATDMTARMPQGVPQADGSVAPEPVMAARHVADAVVHMAELPLEANVLFQTIMATNMPFVGRG
ncbi:MAG: SDR family oxidoreductase [Rhodobacteraceae bacterium]|nr:SDR family oxidoreductase [Paracoccaceae bacterium]